MTLRSVATMVTKRTVLGTSAVAGMTLLAAVSIDILNQWTGDLGAVLWISAGFFVPFVTGVVWGPGGLGILGRIAGAVIGAVIVLAPGIGYVLVERPDLSELRLPLLWGLFTPLGIAQGTIALPVGASARRRAKGAGNRTAEGEAATQE
jgi:hypothetical protein